MGRGPIKAPGGAALLFRGFKGSFKKFMRRERDLATHFGLGRNIQLPKPVDVHCGVKWNRLQLHSAALPAAR